jgi:hypoxanthine phosphoribosyltransferase
MIAIGGGGYVPARIQAIGLSLYETLPSSHPSGTNTPGEVEQLGTKVTRTQWLDLTSLGEMENLVGKRILIVDEVDDTRTTLEYAVKELEKDVEAARKKLGYTGEKTVFSIFVLHVSYTFREVIGRCRRSLTCTRTRTRRRRESYPTI